MAFCQSVVVGARDLAECLRLQLLQIPGTALLVLVRQLGATLVRRDGVVIDSTIGAFGAALRGTAAWRSANDPATWLASQADDSDS